MARQNSGRARQGRGSMALASDVGVSGEDLTTLSTGGGIVDDLVKLVDGKAYKRTFTLEDVSSCGCAPPKCTDILHFFIRSNGFGCIWHPMRLSG